MTTRLDSYRFAVIGAGSMGRALALGLLKGGVSPANVTCTRRDRGRLAALDGTGITLTTDNVDAIRSADVVLLCVKPQGWRDAVASVRDAFRPGQTVVSVLAGVSLAALEAALPEGLAVVRAMPNTPALVGQGMTPYCTGAGPLAEGLAEAIFRSSGTAVKLPEALMDAATATSGSGPAYVFYLAECMRAGAEALGLGSDVAASLVLQTFRGAVALLEHGEFDPVRLRAQVTSPGGATAAAIAVLEGGGARDRIADAMAAGAQRSAELGR